MASPKSLLDRLAAPDPRRARAAEGDERALRSAVRAHLQILLNARRGYATSIPDFGIGDFTELYRANLQHNDTEEDLRVAIEKFEPRLQNVRVSLFENEDDPLNIQFQIRGVIKFGERQVRADFVSRIDPNGTMKVD